MASDLDPLQKYTGPIDQVRQNAVTWLTSWTRMVVDHTGHYAQEGLA